jgi:hypothetical protein
MPESINVPVSTICRTVSRYACAVANGSVGPIQHRHSLVSRGDLHVDVTAAGELLVRGQAEVLGHALVPAGADRPGVDRDRRGAQGRHLDSGPAGRGGSRRPASAHVTVQVIQRLTRPRIGLQLLLLEFGFQVRSGGLARDLQHGPGHRPGPSRPRFDEQELLFHAHAARTHHPNLPPDRVFI